MVRWTLPAKEDLKTVHDYIAKDSKFYAERVVEYAIELAEGLKDFPRSGRVVPEISNDNVREIFVYSYRLIYEIQKEGIFVLAFIHGARDMESKVFDYLRKQT